MLSVFLMVMPIVSEATIVSCRVYKNEEKDRVEGETKEEEAERIVILGDVHCEGFSKQDQSPRVAVDRMQKKILFNLLDALPKSKGSTGVLYEHNLTRVYRSKEELALSNDYFDILSGFHEFATSKRQDPSVLYIPFDDLRTFSLMGPVQMNANLNRTVKDNFGQSFKEFADCKERACFFNDKGVSDYIKNVAGNVTVKEYLDELDQLPQQSVSTVHFDKICELVGATHAFFENKNSSDRCADVIYNTIVADQGAYLSFNDKVVYPLAFLLGDVSLELAFNAARKKFNQVIIFTGNNHAVHVYNLMAKWGDRYKLTFKRGLQQPFDLIPQDFQITTCPLGVLSILFGKKVCFTCNKEVQKLRYCGKCKKAKYCSIACQKADWSGHKQECATY